MDEGHPARIYHLAVAADWAEAKAAGHYRTSTRGRSLEEEGFIHCSFAGQVAATAERYYADAEDVVLLHVDTACLASPVVIEDLAGTGAAFPHVYGPIDVDAVVEACPLRRDTTGRWVIDLDPTA